ncbi:MAG: dephospho-CoA kinase, partial [Acidobacteriota bacterium]
LMLKVGLTGGIASGKSYVLGLLRDFGCHVLDADATAHQVMEPGEPAHAAIVAHFGAEILDSAGRIDRPRLGAIVFADPAQRAALNAIVHPRVYEAQANWLIEVEAQHPGGIAIIDAALMIETGSWRRFDRLVVVHCMPEIQLSRLMERNGLSREAAEARIAAQLPVAEKLRYADFTVDTSAGFDDTRRQVEVLYRQLRELASSPPSQR